MFIGSEPRLPGPFLLGLLVWGVGTGVGGRMHLPSSSLPTTPPWLPPCERPESWALLTIRATCEHIRIHWALFFVGIKAGLPFEDQQAYS